MLKHFPVSESIFKELVKKEDNNYYYYFADKTLLIQEILENHRRVTLITRPRRFGKSTNMSMLEYFFDIRKADESLELFKGLKIENAHLSNGKSCMEYRGKYPVIMLNFKILGQSNYAEFLEMFKKMLSKLYLEHDYLLESEKLTSAEKNICEKIINDQAEERDYKNALNHLIANLRRHFNQRVIVLIDEYDTPFQRAIHTGLHLKDNGNYFENLKILMGTFLGEGLKDNEDLENCVMTGIVRISGAGIFSQLNNVDVWTVLDEKFSEHFGITEKELELLLKDANRKSEIKQFSHWYNGYQFGKTIIYNPFSIIKSLDRNNFDSYWLDSSNNQLIYDSLLKPQGEIERLEINQTIASLMAKNDVTKIISNSLVFDSKINSMEHLWTLLISAGYLKVKSAIRINDTTKATCTLQIPNQEVWNIYNDVFTLWIKEFGIREDSSLMNHLLSGNAEKFCEELKRFFIQVISFRDISEKQIFTDQDAKYEAYYHGFMVGMLGLSMYRSKARLISNRESGYGYYDLVIEPRDIQDPIYNKAIIFEFKRAESDENLSHVAEAALAQIKKNHYATDIFARGIKQIVIIGAAFCGKQLETCYEIL